MATNPPPLPQNEGGPGMFGSFGNVNQLIAKYSDLFIAFLVILVVGMIIIPLPTWLIDILLIILLQE